MSESEAQISRGGIVVECLQTRGHLDALTPEWTALAAATPEATGFQSPQWCLKWVEACEASGAALRPYVVTVRENGVLVMLWPLQIERRFGVGVARWLGEPMTQYGDALAAPGEGRARWFAAAMQALDGQQDADLLAFGRLRADSVLASFHFGGRFVLEGEALQAPFVAVGESGARHKSMERRARRLAQFGEVHLVEGSPPQEREALARRALELKRQWLRDKGFFSAGLSHTEADAFLALAARDGALRVHALAVGKEIAAVEFGLIGGGAYRSFLSAFDDKFAQGSPGQALTRRVIARCAAEGLAQYDMLPPGDAYKRAWTSESVTVRSRFAPLTVKGALAAIVLAKLRPLAKRVLKSRAIHALAGVRAYAPRADFDLRQAAKKA